MENETAVPVISTGPPPTMRSLKIEADGDPWKGLIKPKIRLIGKWLQNAGFKPGHRVRVTCVEAGVIELRSIHETEQTPTAGA